MLEVTNDWEDVEAAQEREDVVVYFTADWCGPCQQLKPQYAKASVNDTSHDYFLVDIDKVDPYVVRDWKIQTVPSVWFWRQNGEKVKIESRKWDKIVDEVSGLD